MGKEADRPTQLDGRSFESAETTARENLARDLHNELERLDPSTDGDDWLTLKPYQREMYRSAINYVIRNPDKVIEALGSNLTNNDSINGCCKKRKQTD